MIGFIQGPVVRAKASESERGQYHPRERMDQSSKIKSNEVHIVLECQTHPLTQAVLTSLH